MDSQLYTNEPENFDRDLEEIKNSLTDFQKEKTGLVNEIKLKNSELKKLIESYQQKDSFKKITSSYDNLKSDISEKEKAINFKEKNSYSLDRDLRQRELDLHKDLEALEQRKLLLDAKERVVSKAISSELDPSVIRVLDNLESSYNLLKQERSLLKSDKDLIQNEWDRIKKKEEGLFSLQRNMLSEKRKFENEIRMLDAEISDKEIYINSLKQKEADINSVVKEKIDLVNNLDRQYKEQKNELNVLKEKIDSERKLLLQTKQDIEEGKVVLENEKRSFLEQKNNFFRNIDELSKKSKEEISNHKKQVINELELKQEAVESRMRELESKELIFEKLQREITKKEDKLSRELDLISQKNQEFINLKDNVDKRTRALDLKEKELQRYEKEVSEFEKTVFELKNAIDQKRKETEDEFQKAEKYKVFFNELKSSGKIDDKFESLKNAINNNISNGNLLEAKKDFAKFHFFVRSLPSDARNSYKQDLVDLHKKLNQAFHNKVFKK